MTMAVFWQVKDFQFIKMDDPNYVVKNAHLRAGFTAEGLTWAFTTTQASNWHPLTWLSLMLDYRLFDLNPRGYHLTNLYLHVANVLLLFLVLRRMTEALWQSAFVAALFAVHPLHVESVAWVAERKDLLSTFFWFLTMGAYTFYVQRPGVQRYLSVLACFILGVMAKPMLVTLPFVLLILDYWPLGRMLFGTATAKQCRPMDSLDRVRKRKKKIETGIRQNESGCNRNRSSVRFLIVEKVPLFLISVFSIAMTLYAQKGAMQPMETFTLYERIANAIQSYVLYIWKMFWPQDLVAFYPYQDVFPLFHVLAAVLFLVSVTMLVIVSAKNKPYLVTGWLWYLGTLVPVIGLVQVGGQAMADRYTYVPLIGLFIFVAWLVPDLLKKMPLRNTILGVSSVLVLVVLMLISSMQTRYWRDTITLFEHALAKTTKNIMAHNSLGIAYLEQGKINEAANHLTMALEINPMHTDARNNLGGVLLSQGRDEEAIFHLTKVVDLKPDFAGAHNNLGIAYRRLGRLEDAIREYSKAIQIDPTYAEAYNNLGVVFLNQGKTQEAADLFNRAARIKPDYVAAKNNLRMTLDRIQADSKETR